MAIVGQVQAMSVMFQLLYSSLKNIEKGGTVVDTKHNFQLLNIQANVNGHTHSISVSIDWCIPHCTSKTGNGSGLSM